MRSRVLLFVYIYGENEMKKVMVVLFLVGILLLSACQADQPAPAPTSAPSVPGQAAASEPQPAPAAGVVKIGVIQPLSGPDGKYGEVIVPAYEYAVKQVNDAGGIKSLGGARLEIVWSDHQSSAETAISEVERLIERERVSVIAGANLSGIVLAATTATERLQVPFVVDVPAATAITERGFEYVFRTNVSGLFYGDTFAEFVNYLNEQGAGLESVAVTFRDLEFPQSVMDPVRDRSREEGLNVVYYGAYPAEASDLTTYAAQVRGSNPDVIATADNSVAYASLFTRGLNDLKVNPKMIITANGAYEFEDWYSGVGDLKEGFLLMVQWNADVADPALATDYAQYTREPLNGHALLSMQAVYAIAEALELAGSTDPKAIRDALAVVRIEPGPRLVMPWSYLDYNEKGQNTGAQNMVVQWQDGKLVTVYPPEYATAQPIVPFNYWQR
jgi:branched-chain amino acid transport system substrate-binding protein